MSEKESKVQFSRLHHELNTLKYFQELKDAFFAELGQNKPAPIDNPAESNSPIPKVATKGKGKLRLKKKIADDPFASDNDDNTDRTSKNPTADLKRPNDDEDEEEAKSKKKRIT